MPTYDYECAACQERFEVFHPMLAPVPPCPNCDGAVRKIITIAPAIHGEMARGREAAVRSLPECGKGCSCCPPTAAKADASAPT